LSDLDLTRGDVPFKEFCTQKNPKGDNEKYLVIATWFHKYGGLDTISTDHIFTGYQTMSWKSNQRDVGQPLRFMKKKRSYFENPEKNTWKITHVGLAAAEQIGIS